MTSLPLVSARSLERVFTLGSDQIRAIHDIDLDIFSGQLVAITGRSGAGKTTLLNLLAGLDHATSGAVYFRAQNLSWFSEGSLAKLRRGNISFVFQSFGLIPLLSAYENVELPLRINGWGVRDRRRRTEECLNLVDLSGRAGHRPYELSGGEQQRVSIARALASRPAIILADEPTGELDSSTGAAIRILLKEIVERENIAIVVASHDITIAEIATVSRQLSDGTFID